MFGVTTAALLAIAVATIRAAIATPIAVQLAKAAVSGAAGAIVKEAAKRKRDGRWKARKDARG